MLLNDRQNDIADSLGGSFHAKTNRRGRGSAGISFARGTPRRVMSNDRFVLWTWSMSSEHFALNSEIGKGRIVSLKIQSTEP